MIRGEAWDKIMSLMLGALGGIAGGTALHEFGWRGVLGAIVVALIFFGIGACGGAL